MFRPLALPELKQSENYLLIRSYTKTSIIDDSINRGKRVYGDMPQKIGKSMQPIEFDILFQNLIPWDLKYLWLIGGLCLTSILLSLFWFLCLLIYMGNKSQNVSKK